MSLVFILGLIISRRFLMAVGIAIVGFHVFQSIRFFLYCPVILIHASWFYRYI
jgi:hypothetical protein